MRKHGQTNVEYIRVLERKIKKLEETILEQEKINRQLINHRNIVSLTEYQQLKKDYTYLIDRLKLMNLWVEK